MIFKFTNEDPSQRRISFFINFLDSFGISRRKILEYCGMDDGYLNNVFNSDNIKLSVMKRICKKLGYSCQIFLEPQSPADAEEYRNRCLRTKYSEPSEAKNLDFFLDFLEIEGMTKSDVGKRVGLSRSRVTYWVSRDDITLRRVFAICRAYHRNFHVVVKPLPNSFTNQQISKDDSMVIYDLYHHHCYKMGGGKNTNSRK